MPHLDLTFDAFFEKATGNPPYPYQRRLADDPDFPELLDVPTGMGKTAAAVLAWLWRRRFHPDPAVRSRTPRRLVYCLPMRALVEQTTRVVERWLAALVACRVLAGDDVPGVHLLMGGDLDESWEAYPEAEGVLIGTQDQLLSRALNRGYAMSRYRWPVHFALLHNDCLWVADEVQLMGVGVETTAQLQGLRCVLQTHGPAATLWMSATLQDATLATPDHRPGAEGFRKHRLSPQERELPAVRQRVAARKNLCHATVSLTKAGEKTYATDLAALVTAAHRPGSLTLVVMNRVKRAQDLYLALEKHLATLPDRPRLALIHARMRPPDRARHEALLFGKECSEGRIIVATQTIEAGVDVSARTLFTELAPWSSLVQRFGRCNRYGEYEDAKIYVVDIEGDEALAQPYESEDLARSHGYLRQLEEVGPSSLASIQDVPRSVIRPVLRRKDLLDLFDTSADLAGNDLDVSRYIRDGEDHDVQFFWRSLEGSPTAIEPAPFREELCRVAIGPARSFLKKSPGWRWNTVDGCWQEAKDARPGQTLLLTLAQGGYDPRVGWTGDPRHQPMVIPCSLPMQSAGLDEDPEAFISRWVTLAEHSADAKAEAGALAEALSASYPELPWSAVVEAAHRHDRGKAHEAFRNMLCRHLEPDAPHRQTLWAKSDRGGRAIYEVQIGTRMLARPGFRHELASSLAWLSQATGHPEQDLIAYLIAAHHGKVRMSLRSLPKESPPPEPERIFARGVWDGDALPEVELEPSPKWPDCELDLSVMVLGRGPTGPSWLERTLELRDRFGPFRLALMEALVRVSDWRASGKERTHVR